MFRINIKLLLSVIFALLLAITVAFGSSLILPKEEAFQPEVIQSTGQKVNNITDLAY